jgi:phospholipase/carboxylesterase
MMKSSKLHSGDGVRISGAPLRAATASTQSGDAEEELATSAIVLLHGRNATADDILTLGQTIVKGTAIQRMTLVAPQATERTWYPQSFLAPREVNEPWLSSALDWIDQIMQMLGTYSIPAERIVLCGFSQGACLAAEYLATRPKAYAAALLFTGGLPGPGEEHRTANSSLAGTPVLLSSGDPDPHVPWQRVLFTAEELTNMGAKVTLKQYPGRPHTIIRDELANAISIVGAVL